MAPRSASALVGALQMCSGFKSVARSQLFVAATWRTAARTRRFIVWGCPTPWGAPFLAKSEELAQDTGK